MNTIQLGNAISQIDISKYLREIIPEEVAQEKATQDIQQDIPTKGTKQYDELKATLVTAKLPVTEENIRTANLMLKSGIEIHKETMEAVVDIKKQLEYVINHVSPESLQLVTNNGMSLDKITINILENVIKDVNNKSETIKELTQEEIKKATDKYIQENKLEENSSKEELETISKCIEKLLAQELPITTKNIQNLISVVNKSEQIKNIDKDIAISLIKKDKAITIENIYVAKYSSSKYIDKSSKNINNEDWKALLPQIEKLINKESVVNKDETIKIAKLLLENDLPITNENISKVVDIENLQTQHINTNKLLEEAAKNIKSDKSAADIELHKVMGLSVKNTNAVQQAINSDKTNYSEQKENQIEHKYQQIIENLPKYDNETIKDVLENGEEVSLKDLQTAYEQMQSTKKPEQSNISNQIEDVQLTQEQKKEFQTNIKKELKIVTAKRQLAEIRLRLTSEAMTMLMNKGIEIDTLPLKEVVKELKAIESDLYKSQLKMAGAEVTDTNIQQMTELYDKLSNITSLTPPTYKDVIHKEIPFSIDGLSEAEKVHTSEEFQQKQVSQIYETLQTQPNPKFKESFTKVKEQVEPLIQSLNIESTEENIRAAQILVKNKMEVNPENILDIKLIDTKVTQVTTQLHPTIAANMIKDGLQPAVMEIDEVLTYMDKFKELLGEDLTDKIASYIYDMDKAKELTPPQRETMIGIYRMLYTVEKTQGRATGFVVKNNMELTLNNLMEAANYYDRTNARYSDIDIKVDDNFGTLEKVIVNDKSIKAQLTKANKAIEEDLNKPKSIEQTVATKEEFIKNEKQQIIENKNITNELIQKASPEIISKLIKEYPDIEKTPVKEILNFISKTEVKEKSEPLVKMNIDEVLNYIEKDKTLTAKNKEIILKIHNLFESLDTKVIETIERNNKEFTLDNLTKAVNQVKQEVIENKDITNELLQKASPEIISKLIKEYPDIEKTPVKEILNFINKIEVKEKSEPLVKMNIDEVLNYIEKDKTLTANNKEIILRIHNLFETLDTKVIETIESNNKEFTLDNLTKAVNEVKQEVIENKDITNELLQKASPEIISKLIKEYPDIEKTPVKEILNFINKIEVKEKSEPLAKMNIDEVLNYIEKDKTLTANNKEIILKIHNLFESLDNKVIETIESNNKEFTLDNLTKAVNEVKQEVIENKDITNELLQKASPEIISKLIKEYPDIEKMPVKEILSFINKTEVKEKSEPLAKMNIDEVLNYIEKDKTLTAKNKEIVLKIHNLFESLDNKVIETIESNNKEFTLDTLIKVTDNIKKLNEAEPTKIEQVKTSNIQKELETQQNQIQLNKQEYKTIEYDENIINKFIQKAEPEIIAKLIKQYPNIENIPLENILKSMETIEQSKTTVPKTQENKIIQEQTKEFIQNLNKLSSIDPTTMLWMQKHNIPLSVNNMETIQNFMKDPFWFGQELNNFSKDLKKSLGEEKTIGKSVSKKDLASLKSGKSSSQLLDDLAKEIIEVKKETIKLPEQERQNLWKQSSNLEKAIELQKQIQKDETFYQIPIALHNGLTNMNLYVMNDKEGNGKLSESDMRIFVAMETETLGTVQIYMKMSDKSVSFQINSDNPEATKFLKGQQTSLQTSIEDLGYMVRKMQYGEEEKKSPLKNQILPQIKSRGKNMSIEGFETII